MTRNLYRVHRIPLDNQNILMHYGIKGMKWGVRRTPEELGHYTKKRFYEIVHGDITTSKGTHLTDFSDHAYKRMKDPSRPVSYGDILDAVTKPIKVKEVVYDKENRPSQQYLGQKATVCVDPDNGVITTVWKTSHKIAEKYSEK